MDYKISYRKKDKSIQCIIGYKDGDEWKQKAKQGFKAKKDAKPWIDKTLDILKDIVKVPVDYRGITFKKFTEIYLKDKKKEYSYNTTVTYEKAYDKFKKIDDVLVTDISYINLKPCFDDMIDEKLTESTIKDYFTKLKTTLNHAIENYQIITQNPVNLKQYKFPVTAKKKEKIKALTEVELNDLLSKMTGADYFICFFAGKCGMRIGEINGIVDDGSIDFDNGVIHIKRQWKRIAHKKYGLESLKTTNSYRDTPFPINYTAELKDYLDTCIKDMNNRIFINKSNEVTGTRLRYKFKKIGYDISVHDLRHTYVTILIKKGFDFKTIAELIGDTVEIVIKTYAHFTTDMFEDAKKRINEIS